jgi:predicted nucleic acid-binding protein
MASPPAWLIIQSPKIVENIPELDVGERAAISLARELNADRLLIDENAGREAAIARNIKTLRTTAVLLDAANLGIIPDLNAAYDALEKTNFRVKRSVLDQLLKAHEHFKAAERERSRDDDFEHDR